MFDWQVKVIFLNDEIGFLSNVHVSLPHFLFNSNDPDGFICLLKFKIKKELEIYLYQTYINETDLLTFNMKLNIFKFGW